MREIPFPTQWTDASSSGRSLNPMAPSDPGATVRIYQNGGENAPMMALLDVCFDKRPTLAAF